MNYTNGCSASQGVMGGTHHDMPYKKRQEKRGKEERGGVSAGGSRREKGGLCRWRAGHGREEGGCLGVLWMGGWSAVEMGEGI